MVASLFFESFKAGWAPRLQYHEHKQMIRPDTNSIVPHRFTMTQTKAVYFKPVVDPSRNTTTSPLLAAELGILYAEKLDALPANGVTLFQLECKPSSTDPKGKTFKPTKPSFFSATAMIVPKGKACLLS